MKKGMLGSWLGWVPDWVGFSLIVLAGVLAVVYGIVLTPSAGLVAFGVAAVVSAVLAWATGASSSPRVSPGDRSFGGAVERVEGGVWLLVFLLFLTAIVIRLFIS